jgi:hypothetical protein
MSEYQKKSDDAMATLDMIEQAVAKSAGRFDDLRKRADDLYADRLAQIAKANGGDISKANALAVSDEVAQRAYAISNDLAERQSHAHDAGARLATYID